jgi:hypothetical protein
VTTTESGIAVPTLPEIETLERKIRTTAAELPPEEARLLVLLYYQLQEHRIATGNQAKSGGDNPILLHYHTQLSALEKSLPPLLGRWAQSQTIGKWSLSQIGVGPVMAAGLLAHIDIVKFPSVSHLWSFAGQNPMAKWGKGEKRPWNAQLKVLCWKIGDSFVKLNKHPECYYGRIYAHRKEIEVSRNEQGAFAEQAAQVLENRKIKEERTLSFYKAGKLPPGHLDMRARRYAVKRFLSHYYVVGFEAAHGTPAPRPYVETVLGHTHIDAPPNWPMQEDN